MSSPELPSIPDKCKMCFEANSLSTQCIMLGEVLDQIDSQKQSGEEAEVQYFGIDADGNEVEINGLDDNSNEDSGLDVTGEATVSDFDSSLDGSMEGPDINPFSSESMRKSLEEAKTQLANMTSKCIGTLALKGQTNDGIVHEVFICQEPDAGKMRDPMTGEESHVRDFLSENGPVEMVMPQVMRLSLPEQEKPSDD